MDTGITKIELIPSIDDADIRPRLGSFGYCDLRHRPARLS
jgi:hypothetical protein